ncbi:MAG TPA: FG-GAP repeat protein [Polyangium sp.]|nr:FG-GAP repeat protein [Polyangium sp.]
MNLLDVRRLRFGAKGATGDPKSRTLNLEHQRLRQAYRAILLFAALFLAVTSCVDGQKPIDDLSTAAAEKTDTSTKAQIPTSLRMAHMRQVQQDAPAEYAFAVGSDRTNVRADNLQHKFRAEIDERAGLHIARNEASATWNALFQLTAIGRSAEMQAVPSVSDAPEVEHTSARYVRGKDLEESYLNGPLGIEQGFVITHAPSASQDKPLSLEVQVRGSVHPEDTGKGSVALRDDDGNVVLQYSDLLAHDARGQDLRTSMHVEGSSIYLDIADRSATYPITIDPLVWVPDGKMVTKSPGTVFDQLGNTMSVSGDTAIIGAQGNDEKAIDAGAAYVFIRTMTGWVQQQKLVPSDGQNADHFGCSVAIDGDTAIVGAYGQDAGGKTDAGAAYVFVRTNGVWTEQKKVAGLNSDDYFGYSVALSGTTALVGAYGDDSKGALSGAAYVLGRDQGGANNWGSAAKLAPMDGAAQDNFGLSVALNGNTAVIGARGDDDKGSFSGSVYVYFRMGGAWSLQQKLTASDGGPLDYFGAAVAIDVDTVVVGAPFANPMFADAGAAYVFLRAGTMWTEQQKLVSTDPGVQEYFGVNVAVSGNTALIGSWGDDFINMAMTTISDAGAIYVTTRTANVWAAPRRILASDATSGDAYGTAVALQGSTAVVGSPSDDDVGTNAGSAYLLDKDQGGLDNWGEVTKVRALDGLVNEFAGYSVGVSGTTAIAGAYGANDRGNESGVAYVFVNSGMGWNEQAKLAATDSAASDRFGFSSAISGNTAVVGAYLHDGVAVDAGAVYVFVRTGTTWMQQAKITAPDAAAGDNFGVAVAIEGDTMLVGAYADDDKGTNAGSVYVFLRSGTTWAQEAKLTAMDGVANDNFGRAVAISGNTAVVGSPNDDDIATNSGSAYVFLRNGTMWTQEAKLVAADPEASAGLGFSVAINANTALIGAYLDDNDAVPTTTDVGAGYVYVRTGTTWTQETKLIASDGGAGDRLGNAVAIFGDIAVLGAFNDDDVGNNSGTAYVYERTGTMWGAPTKLTAFDAAGGDQFAFAVAYDGTTLVSGSLGDDDRGSASGSAYAFTLRKTLGLGCMVDTECESAHCVDGVCCMNSACPDCYSCGIAGSLGQCAADATAAGTTCGDTTMQPCSAPDTCDAMGVCQPNHSAANSPCGDTMPAACSDPDTCDGAGTCLTNDKTAGTACNDSSDTECTKADTCNSGGQCVPNDEPDGKTCTGGLCMAGMCSGMSTSSSSSSSSSSTSGAGGMGGAGGAGGMGMGEGGAGGGSTTPPVSTEGCGCKVAGETSGNGGGFSLLAMLGMVAASLHRRAQRRKNLAAPAALVTTSMLTLGSLTVGCGADTTGTSPTAGTGGAGNSGDVSSSSGMAGSGNEGGMMNTGGAGGGGVCPPERECAFD